MLAAGRECGKDDFMESSQPRSNNLLKDAAAYEAQFKATFNKELADGTPEEFDQLLAKYLKADKEQQEAYGKKMGEYLMASKQDPNATFDADAQVFYLLSSIRGLTIWGGKPVRKLAKCTLVRSGTWAV